MIMRQGSNVQEFNIKIPKNEYYIDLPDWYVFDYETGITNLRTLEIDIHVKKNEEFQKYMIFLMNVPYLIVVMVLLTLI